MQELSVINIFKEGHDALAEYVERQKRGESREMYIYHTSKEKLEISERKWLGVRVND
ncbi:MAG: hypothetical protein QM401_00500 [Bacillota bacterium]|nr:hypothetical protein [Bacillota bacterium]